MVVRLEWGGLSLVEASYPVGAVYRIDAKAAGTEFGNPQAVVTAIRSRLQNGSLASVSSFDNREGTVHVVVEAATYDGLAAGEAALMGQSSVEGFNTLTWTPNVALCRPTVFDVVYAVLSFAFDDLEETRLRRHFNVSFFSLPFGHAEGLTTVQATTAVPTVTPVTNVINDGSSATGWTATNGSGPTSSGGVVSTTSLGQALPAAAELRLSQREDLFTTSRMYVDWKRSGSATAALTSAWTLEFNGVTYASPQVAPSFNAPAPAAGYARTWFGLPAGTNEGTQVFTRFDFRLPDLLPSETFDIDQVVVFGSGGSGARAISDGSSAAGWSAVGGSAPVTTSGAVRTSANGAFGPRSVALSRNATIDAATTPTVYIDTNDASEGVTLTVTTAGGTTGAGLIAQGVAPSGAARFFFALPASITAFTFQRASVPHGTVFSIDQVVATNVTPGSGTLRQRVRTLAIGGSAPTQASLAIIATTGSLGRGTLVYTRIGSTGFQPNLRPWLVSAGTVTTDTAMVSGARHPLGTAAVYRFPANRIKAAAHALIGLLRTATTGTYTIGWTAKITSAAGADTPESVVTVTGSRTIDMTADTVHSFFELGNLQLPPVLVAADSDRTITLTITGPAAVIVDDFYLPDLDNGVMSLLDTEGLTRLEVRTPNLTSPEESVWGGYATTGAATGLIRQDYRLRSLGQHVFPPGVVEAFTVTTGTEVSALTAMYYPSYHSNVGAPPS